VSSDFQPRSKNGAPAHNTTGVDKTKEIQFDHAGGTIPWHVWRSTAHATSGIWSVEYHLDNRNDKGASGAGPAAYGEIVSWNVLKDASPKAKDLVTYMMSDGYLMDGEALRTEAGFSGKPK